MDGPFDGVDLVLRFLPEKLRCLCFSPVSVVSLNGVDSTSLVPGVPSLVAVIFRPCLVIYLFIAKMVKSKGLPNLLRTTLRKLAARERGFSLHIVSLMGLSPDEYTKATAKE
jgi:hypothetical protein